MTNHETPDTNLIQKGVIVKRNEKNLKQDAAGVWHLNFRVPVRFGGKLIRQSLFTEDFDVAASWVALIHYLLAAYIKFISRLGISLTEITIRIRYALMMNCDLMEVLRWDRKTILKPPDWNRPRQMEFFGDFLC